MVEDGFPNDGVGVKRTSVRGAPKHYTGTYQMALKRQRLRHLMR